MINNICNYMYTAILSESLGHQICMSQLNIFVTEACIDTVVPYAGSWLEEKKTER
jgi:hypothetical protein